jgi:hypothetical protein
MLQKEGRREKGRGRREEGRGKREEGRGKRGKGKGRSESLFPLSSRLFRPPSLLLVFSMGFTLLIRW